VDGFQNRNQVLEESQTYIARALDLNPLLPEAHGANAEWLRAQKRFDEAQAAIDRALELRPSYAEAYAIQASMHAMRGETDDELRNIRKATELDPQENRYQTRLAGALWSASRSEEAIATVKDALRRNPQIPGNYSTLSRWIEQMGRLGEALYWSYQQRMLEPQAKSSRWSQCFDLIRVWRMEQAEACLRRYLQSYPGYTEAIQYLSILTGDTETAIANLEKAVAENPNFWYRRYQLADWLVASGRWQETLDILEPTAPQLAQSPPVVNDFTTWPLINLAQAHRGLGDEARSTELLEAGLNYLERRRKLQAGGLSAGVEDVMYLILLGREDEAMRRLQGAIDSGWRFFSMGLHGKFYDRMRDDPRFQAQLARLAAIMDEEWAWFEAHKDDPISQHL
jgi:tetratricopeptide (TPR) repeat protein